MATGPWSKMAPALGSRRLIRIRFAGANFGVRWDKMNVGSRSDSDHPIRGCLSGNARTTQMAKMWKNDRLLPSATGIAFLAAILFATGAATQQQPAAITITLAGQSMIRSDIRATAPAAVPIIPGLLTGDVIFTHLESAVAGNGEPAHEG